MCVFVETMPQVLGIILKLCCQQFSLRLFLKYKLVSKTTCSQLELWIIETRTLFVGKTHAVEFLKCFEHCKLNVIHHHCTEVVPRMSEMFTLKPYQINPKLSPWLDAVKVERKHGQV